MTKIERQDTREGHQAIITTNKTSERISIQKKQDKDKNRQDSNGRRPENGVYFLCVIQWRRFIISFR
jgi:hypothetical protein